MYIHLPFLQIAEQRNAQKREVAGGHNRVGRIARGGTGTGNAKLVSLGYSWRGTRPTGCARTISTISSLAAVFYLLSSELLLHKNVSVVQLPQCIMCSCKHVAVHWTVII